MELKIYVVKNNSYFHFRLILAYAGADFEDKRIEFAQWPKLKPTLPYNQLPTLDIDGHNLCQSMTVAR